MGEMTEDGAAIEVAMGVEGDSEVEEALGVVASGDEGDGERSIWDVLFETAFSDGVDSGLNTLMHSCVIITDTKKTMIPCH